MKVRIGENLRSCFATSRLAALPDGGARRPAEEGAHAAAAARILAALPAAAALSSNARVDHLRRHPARLQLLPRLACDDTRVAPLGARPPRLSAAGGARC